MVEQVLASDSSPQELGEQAAGVIQAVLQGRNSVVVAMGQPASAKSHTLLGHDPTDPQASSSSPGKPLPSSLTLHSGDVPPTPLLSL